MINEDFFVVIDIGATNVRVAGTHSLENPYFKNFRSFQLSHDFESDFNMIIKMTKEASEQKVSAVGIALPGRLNDNKSLLVAAINLPQWVGKNIKQRMEMAMGCKSFFENDAVASGLGHAIYGKATPHDFLFIIWGTGIGGAIVHTQPALRSAKLERKAYLSATENVCGGKIILQKYGKTFSELENSEQLKIIKYFLSNLAKQSKKLSVAHIILGGGIGIEHGEKIIQAAGKLPETSGINFQITSLGNTFGLYGAAALIKLGCG